MKLKLASGTKMRLRSALSMAIATLAAEAEPPPPPPPPPPVDEPPPPVDTTITATPNEVTNLRVYQRVGTSKDIVVSGSFTGNPDTIDARLVNADTGAPVTNWSTIVTAPTGGTFSGIFNAPQGYWYKVQVRGATATTASTPASTANRFGVGIIVLMIGQSNMVNRRSTGLKNPLTDKRTVEYFGGVWNRHGNYNDNLPLNYELDEPGYVSVVGNKSGRSDGYVLIGNLLAQGLDLPVALVPCADGGSPISQLITAIDGSDWRNHVLPALNAVGGDCEIVFLQQGESDAYNMDMATRKTRLGQLLAQCHQQTGRSASTMKFFLTSLGVGSFNGSTEGEFGNIRAADIEWSTSTPGAYLAASAHVGRTADIDNSASMDQVHWGGETFNWTVKCEARSMLAAYGVGVSGAGPYITGATRTGSMIVVNVGHSGGTTLLDGAGGNGTALKGFQVYINGSEEAIASTEIAGNTIKLQLAQAVPAGAVVTMSYAMMNCPHNTTPTDARTHLVLASVPYDNVVLHRSTRGCPLQPKAVFTVTGA